MTAAELSQRDSRQHHVRSTPGAVHDLWTCPMHPQVQRAGPGSCPICGMALEPMTPAGGDAANPELRDMTRRFWVCVGLSVPLVALAMAGDIGNPGLLPPRAAIWVQLVLATPAVLWGGWPFFERGWRSLVSRRLNMFTLIAIGTGVAYPYSLVAALMPGMFPAFVPHPGRRGSGLFRAGGGHRDPGPARPGPGAARPRANRSAIRALLDLAPTRARLVRDDGSRPTSRSKRSSPETACVSGPARRCRSTASCSKERARSTSR